MTGQNHAMNEAINETTAPLRPALASLLHETNDLCTNCGVCAGECDYLKLYGTPGQITHGFDPTDPKKGALGFECSLCSLCTAVCPAGLDPKALFLEMRRKAVERGAGHFAEHKGLLGYERTGTSRRFTWYGLPEGCDTVFFPGCALPGTRPEATFAVYEKLRETIPAIGLVLDCCTKPSHDLGRQEFFTRMFGEMAAWLEARGVGRVLVACPNCHLVFSRYAPQLETITVYEVLAEALPARAEQDSLPPLSPVTVHDPCVMRFASSPQQAVRALASAAGQSVEEMPHSRSTALCCGEGGTVRPLAPDLADGWGERRTVEASGRPVLTYCAGCANHLGKRVSVTHILDIICATPKPSKGPITYLNRLRLKARFKKAVPAAVTRERTDAGGSTSLLRPLLILAAVVTAIVLVRASGLSQYLEPEKLRALFAGFGVIAPLVYIAFFTLAPALMLPGLPISMAGATVFGPFWGVVYTIIGATLGACVAFLIARYGARGWVERRLVGSRWNRLYAETELNGWKAVAFTRLIPLFPFNLLNFAFGLTKISFFQYAVATFLFMLPGTIAFITFSSSLLGLVKGQISAEFFIGLLLIAGVSMIPRITRRVQLRQEQKPRIAAPWGLGRSLKQKTLVLAAVGAASAAAYGLIQKYFWAIDAHLYTLEFNLLCMANRLQDADLPAFIEYLRPMSPLRAAGVATSCQTMQTFGFPLSALPTATAFIEAFGPLQGALYAFAACLTATGLAVALGRFLLGDLLPLFRCRSGVEPLTPPPRWTGWLAALLTSVPGLPLVICGFFAGTVRVPWSRALILIGTGLFVRILVSVSL